ncbi:MAG TPA: hypothetical protein VK595_07865, partial [Vicinamibacterales bacterium]|nr:hypothetical protein [Vicinamibacterales bacterium]
MSEVVTRLRDRRANVWEQAKELADTAANENRAVGAEEQSKWDTLNAELDALDTRVKSVIEGEQRAKDTEEAFSRLEGKPREQGGQGAGGEKGSEELRKFLRGEGGRS